MPEQPEQIHQRFVAAFNRGDSDALLDLYEDDAVLVAQPGQQVQGKDGIGEALQGFLGLSGPIDLQTKAVVRVGDIAYLAGSWTLDGKAPDGSPVHLEGVTAEVLRRGPDGRWRYLIDNPWGDAVAQR